MRHRPARRDSRAAALLRRRGLRGERLEPRSMLAADVDVADVGVPWDGVSGASVPGVVVNESSEDVSAVACEFIACEFPIAAEPCVLIDPECTVDVRITTDPPEFWVPITFDPEASEAGDATGAVDGQSVDLQEPVSGDCEAGDFWDGDAAAADGSDDALPEGLSLMICSGVIDLPVLLAEEPVAAVTAVAEDTVAEPVIEPIMATEAAGDEQLVVMAMASSTTSASLTTPPAVKTGASDAARLFAAYAAGLGQGGADPQSSTMIGGRRSGRRAN